MGKKRILLRLIEPMNFIDKEDRRHPPRSPLLRRFDNLTQFRNPSGDRRERHELRFCILGDQARQRRFATTWRAPEDYGRESILLDRRSQRTPRPYHVVLTDEVIETFRT